MHSCARHPGASAVADCPVCGAPFCAECRVEKVGAEKVYCSDACRARDGLVASVSDAELAAAAKTPIRSGWRLWVRSAPWVSRHTLPVAAVMALLVVMSGSTIAGAMDESRGPAPSLAATVILWGLFGYGIALSGVVLSSTHTGHRVGNAHLWTLRRLVPVVVVWAMVLAAGFLGFLLLIIPGIIIGIRLFWADEFALVHAAGPLTACRESWRLTRNREGSVFVFQFILGLAEYLILILVVIAFLGITLGANGIGARSAVISFVEATLVFWLVFTAYGSAHAPELVYFYGLRAGKQAEKGT